MKLLTSLAAGCLVLAATPAHAAAPGNTYRHYAACGVSHQQRPSHSCPKAGRKGAFFKSVDADVFYKVCVKFPNGHRLCANRQEAPQGVLKVNSITSHMVGQHTVTWFVAGEKVGTFLFRIHA